MPVRSVSPYFLYLSIVDPQGVGVEQEHAEKERTEQERVDQGFLFSCLKPVKTSYHCGLHCMDGTRQSLLDHIMDWVANKSEEWNVCQSNVYWFYSSPGIGKTLLAHSICARLHK